MDRRQYKIQSFLLLCLFALMACAPLSAAVMVDKDDTPEQAKLKFDLMMAKKKEMMQQQQAEFKRTQVAPQQPAAQPPQPLAPVPPPAAQHQGPESDFAWIVWLFGALFLAVVVFVVYEFKKAAKKRQKSMELARLCATLPLKTRQ